MPIMDGYELCERMSEIYESFNGLPDYEDLDCEKEEM